MSRYLTPSRISLLALIYLYTESAVPSAATIPVLQFLSAHVLHPTPATSSLFKTESLIVLNIEDLQRATSAHASIKPGRTLWDLLLNKLWAIDSLDGLYRFFDELFFLLLPTSDDGAQEENPNEYDDPNPNRVHLSPVSPLGVYVRKARVEFTSLQFDNTIILWKRFRKFRASTLPQWKKRNSSTGSTSLDVDLEASSSDRLTDLLYGEEIEGDGSQMNMCTVDLEKLLQLQVEQMQDSGGRLPIEIKHGVQSMLQSAGTLNTVSFYAAFLDSWKAGDYSSAFDNLHRYFDHTMSNRKPAPLQYALMNLALLHSDFDANTEALAAMRETISYAREVDDAACLNFCAMWLHRFGSAHPDLVPEIERRGFQGPDSEALSTLKTTAVETQRWGLLSQALLSEADVVMFEGGNPSYALENILKASHVNLVKNMTNQVGGQMLLLAAAYGRLGMGYQATLIVDIFQNCFLYQGGVDDDVQARCTASHLLALRGRFKEAFAMMEAIDQRHLRVHKPRKSWLIQMGILKLRRSLVRGRLDAAEDILRDLKAQPGLTLSFTQRIQLFEIDLQMRRKDFPLALEVLEKLTSDRAPQESEYWIQIKAMILKARICDAAGLAPKGFSVALRAISIAWNSKMLALLWESVGELCAVLNSLLEFEASTRLLESVLPYALETEDCELGGRMFSLLADAHVGMAGEIQPSLGQPQQQQQQRKEKLAQGLECLEGSLQQYSQLGDVAAQCEILAKKATLMYVNGDLALADNVAAEYLDVKRVAREEEKG